MVKKTDYAETVVEAARSVLLELAHLLGEYHDDMVLIGGWVPEILLKESGSKHCGSIDIDMALNHITIDEAHYTRIRQLLCDRGYKEGTQPFIFYRDVKLHERKCRVQVDFLAGEYLGTGKSHRNQRVQDIMARKARGCDLAFDHFCEVKVDGFLPNGARDSAVIRVASMIPFLVMKGMALHDRLKEKDAWDVYYCLRNYPGGLDKLVEEFTPYVNDALVREGLQKLAGKFSSPQHIGPRFIADFEGVTDQEDRDFLQRDAYERVKYFIESVGLNIEE